MISCDYAEQSINLNWALIKFLKFEGILWSGDSLPLKLQALGELQQVKCDLTQQKGGKKTKAHWERGMVHAQFQPGVLYDLALRLEYLLPAFEDRYTTDFQSIHPRRYMTGVDYQLGQPGGSAVVVRLGQDIVEVGPGEDQDLADGHQLRYYEQQEFARVAVSRQSETPYAHPFFPVLSFK